MPFRSLRWITYPLMMLAGLGLMGLALGGFILMLAYPQLPSVETLTVSS